MKLFARGGVVSVSSQKLPLVGEVTEPSISFREVEPAYVGVDFAGSESFTVEVEVVGGQLNMASARRLPVIPDDESN